MGHHLKMAPNVIVTMRLPSLRTTLTEGDIQRWSDIMAAQGMLKRRAEPAAVLYP